MSQWWIILCIEADPNVCLVNHLYYSVQTSRICLPSRQIITYIVSVDIAQHQPAYKVLTSLPFRWAQCADGMLVPLFYIMCEEYWCTTSLKHRCHVGRYSKVEHVCRDPATNNYFLIYTNVIPVSFTNVQSNILRRRTFQKGVPSRNIRSHYAPGSPYEHDGDLS